MTDNPIERICWACRHICFEQGYPSTDATPGYDTELHYAKGHWDLLEDSSDSIPQMHLKECLEKARDCEDFDLHDEFKPPPDPKPEPPLIFALYMSDPEGVNYVKEYEAQDGFEGRLFEVGEELTERNLHWYVQDSKGGMMHNSKVDKSIKGQIREYWKRVKAQEESSD